MFRWISAGASYSAFGGLYLNIKEKRRKGEYEEILYPEGTIVKLQDKELFIAKSSNKDYNFYSPTSNWDSMLSMDYLNDSSVCHTGVMFCYEYKKSKRNFSYNKNVGYPLFGDSGGYPLMTGTIDFIDPVDLAMWYNKYVNYGMALDIPITHSTNKELYPKLIEIHKKNLDIIVDNVDTTVEMYNVCHGHSIKYRREYIDGVYRDDIKNWALGTSYYGTYIDFLYNCVAAFEYLKAPKYHIFGISDTMMIPILAWLGKYYELTSDSSTPMQSGTSSIVFSIQGKKLLKFGAGRIQSKMLSSNNIFPYLPCSCNICNVLKTTELIYKNKHRSLGAIVCTLHNVNTMAKYISIWNELANECNITEYFNNIKAIANRKYAKYILEAVEYIEDIQQTSFEKASKKRMGYYINSLFTKKHTYTDIFNEKMLTAEEEFDSVTNLIRRYEKYHDGKYKKQRLSKKHRAKRKLHTLKVKSKMGLTARTQKRKLYAKKKINKVSS